MNAWYRNKSVTVTGGAGFIGSHLVEQLVKYGAKVTILDDLSTGSVTNLESVLPDITVIYGSITDMKKCLEATKHAEIVFHLAAQISVPESFEKPNDCYTTNVTGTQFMLEAARINGAYRFVFSSSCAVYGNQKGPLSEDVSCKPQSPYGCSKLIGELLCNQYTKDFGLETVCLRYFNVFGVRQRADGPYSGVVAKFKQNMAKNKSLVIYGDGLQQRDFVPVEMIVDANLLAGMLPAQQVCGQTFNVATGKSISLLNLVEQLRKEFPNYTAPISHITSRPGDIHSVYADIKKYQHYMIEGSFSEDTPPAQQQAHRSLEENVGQQTV